MGLRSAILQQRWDLVALVCQKASKLGVAPEASHELLFIYEVVTRRNESMKGKPVIRKVNTLTNAPASPRGASTIITSTAAASSSFARSSPSSPSSLTSPSSRSSPTSYSSPFSSSLTSSSVMRGRSGQMQQRLSSQQQQHQQQHQQQRRTGSGTPVMMMRGGGQSLSPYSSTSPTHTFRARPTRAAPKTPALMGPGGRVNERTSGQGYRSPGAFGGSFRP